MRENQGDDDMSNETIIRDTYKRINRFGLCLVEYSILKDDLIKAPDKAREEGYQKALEDLCISPDRISKSEKK